MADFYYSAIDVKGQSMEGIMTAESEVDLDLKLQELGYWLVDASQKTKKKSNSL